MLLMDRLCIIPMALVTVNTVGVICMMSNMVDARLRESHGSHVPRSHGSYGRLVVNDEAQV